MPQLDPEKQRAFAVDVVRTLRARDFEAYWAGGCVRDQLLGRPPKDFDVATSARPEQIREVFGTGRTVEVGAAFGVITVVGRPKSAGHIEVSTFRQDSTYSDGRHPDSVEFSTAEADAQRRDFTINGLFYDPLEDRVIDFVGGRDDLARGVLRAIGEPRARFAEDKLRLLRAVRFAAALDFKLEPATRDAVEAMAHEITVVSAERIAAEMRLMLVHSSRVRALNLLREDRLLDVVLPELAIANQGSASTVTGRPADEAWLVTLEVLEVLSAPGFPLALAALLQAFVDPDGAEGVARRWKLSKRELQQTVWLISNASALLNARHMPWPRLQRLLISEGIGELLSLHEAIAQAAGKSLAEAEHCRELLQMPPAQLNPAPLLSGDDLIRHGVPRGKQYQRLLEAVRDAQLENKVTTLQEALELVDQLRAVEQEHGPKSD